MFAQLNYLSVSPDVFEKSLSLQKNLSFNFLKSQSFYSSRYFHSAKSSHSESNPSSSSLVAPRITRVARTEAQDVLFNYLHSTRNLHYVDAEHISKNSPTFLQNLLSKVENEQEISRSLSRFLRYNPINEFEPFFESLGLTPSELLSLLPRDLMFLSDDDIMLENFHVLCNYGIPRIKIGKIYVEEREMFRYDYGTLASKLRSYEELGLSKPTVIKLVSCCPSLLIGGINREFVSVLEKMKGLGIENDSIGRFLSDKSTYNWNRMLDTMGFLDKLGYSEEDMGKLLKTHPAFLFEGSGNKIYALVARLLKLGLKMSEILSLFLQHPQILAGKFAINLWRALHFLSEIRMETKEIANIVRTHTHLLCSCSLKGPRTVLKNLKVGRDKFCQIIKEDPHKLFSLALKSRIISIDQVAHEDSRQLVEKTAFLSRLGYIENSDEMTKALKQFRGKGDQLQERFDCLLHAGLDYHVVSNMIKLAPPVLNQTKDVIERKIDYLRNHLCYPLESLVAFPTYLCYDLERIELRFSMYVWLRERGAAKPRLSLNTDKSVCIKLVPDLSSMKIELQHPACDQKHENVYCPIELLANSAEDCDPATDAFKSSTGESSSIFGSKPDCSISKTENGASSQSSNDIIENNSIQYGSRSIETSNVGKCLSETSTSSKEQQSLDSVSVNAGTNLDAVVQVDSEIEDGSQIYTEGICSSSMPFQELGDSFTDRVSLVENCVDEDIGIHNSDSSSVLVVSDSLVCKRSRFTQLYIR
ncbi:hypothetical protein HHK36_019855 [Tetracentron sinense]|uniref:Uncharacterized protein n=1 Tax=Tetracentron sinense TaxID=13715 RepID=A0A834YWY7_TETSI|nr:hypothetical protein HHK36_019855 [Tetracentron sinense]